MRPAAQHSGRLAALLTLICAGLAGLVFLQFAGRHATLAPLPVSSAPVPQEVEREPYDDLDLAPLSAFQEIAERPLFNPTRRPRRDEPEPEKPVQAATSRYLLQGTTSAPEGRKALLLMNGAGRQVWVAEGERLDGWLIELITADRVTMLRAGRRQELSLKDQPRLRRKARPQAQAPRSTVGRTDGEPVTEAPASAKAPAEPTPEDADQGRGDTRD